MSMRKKKDKLMIVFFFAWLLCSCSVDNMLDDWRAGWAAVVTLIVIILVAVVMGSNRRRDEQDHGQGSD